MMKRILPFVYYFIVSSLLLDISAANAQSWFSDSTPSITIDVPFIELRSGPGRGFPVVQVVEQGEQLTVMSKRTAWFKAQDKRGNEGWFHQDDLANFSFQQQPLLTEQQDLDDFLQRTWEGGVAYGQLEKSNYYSLSLAYAFSPVISTEISLAKSVGNVSDSDLAEIALLAQPFPEFIVSPYFSVGGGIIRTTPHSVLADAKQRQNTLMSVALGAKYYLTRNFLLRAEYKYSLVLTDRDDNEEVRVWKLGFSVFF